MYGQTQMREHGGVLPSVRFWWRIWRIWRVFWFAKTAPEFTFNFFKLLLEDELKNYCVIILCSLFLQSVQN
jgi:hypothetical protein